MTPDPELTVDPEQSVEVPESELEEPDQSFALVGAIIRKPANQVIRPLPHVQAFADALLRETGATSFGTYLGHSPTAERAIDAFTPVNSSKLGDAMCAYALTNWRRFGLRYMIYRQRIHWGPGDSWTPMADRGDDTQNHFDHAHFSFETETAEPPPKPDPAPKPEEAEGMKFIAVDNDRGIFLAGENVGEDGKIPARHAGSPEEITALVESGAVGGYDKRPVLPEAVFDSYYRVVG